MNMNTRNISMAKRPTGGRAEDEMAPEAHSQRKRPDEHRFRLQVDRQTKRSFATFDAAEAAGMAIKKEHPVVQVAVYDGVESASKIIELP
jgi:hypothetical protein